MKIALWEAQVEDLLPRDKNLIKKWERVFDLRVRKRKNASYFLVDFDTISPMLFSLSGTIRKLDIPQVVVENAGVGYLVSVPYPLWDSLEDEKGSTLILFTYVREDRLDLYGFADAGERKLFTELVNLSGVGPKLAMEICSIPRAHLVEAVQEGDVATLTGIKGVGKKTAEKLLVDLKSLLEKHPEWAAVTSGTQGKSAAFDADAISALTSLGYDQSSVLDVLKKIPTKLERTEDRVAAALRSL